MKPKFFLKISDHQQSMAPRPLREAFLIPPALLVVADSNLSISVLIGQVVAIPIYKSSATKLFPRLRSEKEAQSGSKHTDNLYKVSVSNLPSLTPET